MPVLREELRQHVVAERMPQPGLIELDQQARMFALPPWCKAPTPMKGSRVVTRYGDWLTELRTKPWRAFCCHESPISRWRERQHRHWRWRSDSAARSETRCRQGPGVAPHPLRDLNEVSAHNFCGRPMRARMEAFARHSGGAF